ncbi:class I SAM-dependent DNA methyltransferase [Aquipuribacter sp. MA13-6]|uniref:class I SAM-dependent DNA methyltransferase n=1 Tax=unclassified Aquipuribacter TaxID=2635084 RepID=UPI003EEA66DC
MTSSYEQPRLAALYDVENPGRWDQDFYLALALELGAVDVVDLGCGTGVLAVALAARGLRVTGVDPAAAMLELARRRPGAERVAWRQGHVGDLPDAAADLVVMSGHVAQLFETDADWQQALVDVRRALRVGGHLAFEMRDPAARAWRGWTPQTTREVLAHPDGGRYEAWVEVVQETVDATGTTVVLHGHTVLPTGEHVVTPETLRFRGQERLTADLAAVGLPVLRTWGDWDRSEVGAGTLELIVLARTDGV